MSRTLESRPHSDHESSISLWFFALLFSNVLSKMPPTDHVWVLSRTMRGSLHISPCIQTFPLKFHDPMLRSTQRVQMLLFYKHCSKMLARYHSPGSNPEERRWRLCKVKKDLVLWDNQRATYLQGGHQIRKLLCEAASLGGKRQILTLRQ